MSRKTPAVEDVAKMIAKVREEQDLDPVEIRKRTRKRVASYLRWVRTLPQMGVDQRLEAVLRRFPNGAPMFSIKVLMDYPDDQDLVERLLALRRQQKMEVVYIVDTDLFGVAEGKRALLMRAAQKRLGRLKMHHRIARQGTRDQVLYRWKADG